MALRLSHRKSHLYCDQVSEVDDSLVVLIEVGRSVSLEILRRN